LRALCDMIRLLNSETDPETLLESILDLAIRSVGAERGMLLLQGPERSFSVRLSRHLEPETETDAESYSRRIVAQASGGRSILAHDAGSDERFRDFRSVSLFRIRSLLCVPLRTRGRVIGTVYVDSRDRGVVFREDDLRFLEAFADHAALALENARARARLEKENAMLQRAAESRAAFGSLVGASEPMQRVFRLLETYASSDLPVLVLGESGTGKELVARALHFNGPRRREVFLSENCAAVPETLLESILFGHVRGAFTGADRDHPGLFEQAHRGTLFLDEIGDMPGSMQARLLRVLQDGEVRRLGAESSVRVDARVVAATHRDLDEAVRERRFREDLLYRLKVLVVDLPPLRDRPGDIPLLVRHFVDRISRDRGVPSPRIDGEILERLEAARWPGNVRQLENTLRRLVLLAGDGAIDRGTVEADDGLRHLLFGPDAAAESPFSLDRNEREQIRRALDACEGSKTLAARMLGVSRATIYRKVKEYGLS